MRQGVTVTAAVLAIVMVAGCSPNAGAGAASADGSPADVNPTTPVTATAIAAPARTADAPARPPAAYLRGTGTGDAGAGDPGAAGAEGSFTWDGSGSDAPWIVLPEPDVEGSGPWDVVFDPPLPVESWTARWAPVTNGAAGDPAAGARGAGAPVRVPPPGGPGAWSLQVDASFGAGRRAAWYWTVEVLP